MPGRPVLLDTRQECARVLGMRTFRYVFLNASADAPRHVPLGGFLDMLPLVCAFSALVSANCSIFFSSIFFSAYNI